MHKSTQFARSMGHEQCDIVIGFDFGTSCTKVVLRTPFHFGGSAFAVPFGDFGHKSCPYFLPSGVWLDDQGHVSLGPQENARFLRDIKFHLMRSEPIRAVNGTDDGAEYDTKAIAVAFLAWALRAARQWFLNEHRIRYGEMDLRWSFNLGLPSENLEDERLCRTYEDVAKGGWLLSIQEAQVTLDSASKALENAISWEEMDERDRADFQLIPEVAAEVAGHAKSIPGGIEEGLYLLVDIGATTLDVCSFILHAVDGEDRYELLTADVREMGASVLYRARVAAVRRAVDNHVSSLWDQYDPVSAMPDSIEAYTPNHESVEFFIAEKNDSYTSECRRAIFKTLIDLKCRRDPRSPRWQSAMPLFLSGGGCVMPFYQSLIDEVSNRLKSGYNPGGIQRLSLAKPVNLEAAVDDQVYHRLAVAWGLSYPDTDIGNVTRPSEIEDVAPREQYDWGGKEFISKDMV